MCVCVCVCVLKHTGTYMCIHTCICRAQWRRTHLRCRRWCRFYPWVKKIPWRRAWQLTPVFLPGEFPWTEEPEGLQSMGSQRVVYDWTTKHTLMVDGSFSFSISPFSEYSGLISLKIDWFDLLAAQGTFRSLLQHQLKGINSSALSLLYSPAHTTNMWPLGRP